MSRRWPWAAGALALAALALWTLAREAGAPAAPPAVPAARKASSAPPPATPAPPRAERNPFRFADEDDPNGPGGTRRPGAGDRLEAVAAAATPAPGPRLVGLVRRGARTVAALTDGGEVELAGPGEAAAGVVVVAIGDEGVRIRRPDGTETVLPLP